jgi:hypothetical protein
VGCKKIATLAFPRNRATDRDLRNTEGTEGSAESAVKNPLAAFLLSHA